MENYGSNVSPDNNTADVVFAERSSIMSMFDELPVRIRQLINEAPRKYSVEEMHKNWQHAKRIGMGDGEFCERVLSVFRERMGDYLTPTYGHARVYSRHQPKGRIRMNTTVSPPATLGAKGPNGEGQNKTADEDKALDTAQPAKNEESEIPAGILKLGALLKAIPKDVPDEFIVYGYNSIKLTLGDLKELSEYL